MNYHQCYCSDYSEGARVPERYNLLRFNSKFSLSNQPILLDFATWKIVFLKVEYSGVFWTLISSVIYDGDDLNSNFVSSRKYKELQTLSSIH